MANSISSNNYPRESNIHEFRNRTYVRILSDRILASFREVGYFFSISYSRISTQSSSLKKYYSLSPKDSWKTNNQGLYVLIHGLNGHPAIWKHHLRLLEKLHPEAVIKAPFVPFKGNCSLEAASNPLLESLKDYAQKNPNNKICLIGVSNGSRIASKLENDLKEFDPKLKIKVSAIAGPFSGTRAMNILEKLGIARFLYHPSIIKDLKYNSNTAKIIFDNMKKSPEGTYDFYATQNDSQVFPMDSSLPQLNRGETHHVVSGYDHNGIVKGVSKEQVNKVFKWMKDK